MIELLASPMQVSWYALPTRRSALASAGALNNLNAIIANVMMQGNNLFHQAQDALPPMPQLPAGITLPAGLPVINLPNQQVCAVFSYCVLLSLAMFLDSYNVSLSARLHCSAFYTPTACYDYPWQCKFTCYGARDRIYNSHNKAHIV